MMSARYIFLALLLAAWFGATALIESFKVSPPAQFERLHRVY